MQAEFAPFSARFLASSHAYFIKHESVFLLSKGLPSFSNGVPLFILSARVSLALAKFNNEKYTSDIDDFAWTNPMSLREYSMINWNARYDEIAIGDVDEEEKCSLTLIGDGVAYCDTLMHDFDEWIIKKMDSTKGKNEKLK